MANPQRQKEKVYIGCGAGFGGDRPVAALKLLQRVKELDYLVLEYLAERTLAERYQAMKSGGKGYDPCISEWMQLLLPLAMENGVCIITNMGAKVQKGQYIWYIYGSQYCATHTLNCLKNRKLLAQDSFLPR